MKMDPKSNGNYNFQTRNTRLHLWDWSDPGTSTRFAQCRGCHDKTIRPHTTLVVRVLLLFESVDGGRSRVIVHI